MYMTRGEIVIEPRSAEVNIPPRSYIKAIDWPTVLYVLYSM